MKDKRKKIPAATTGEVVPYKVQQKLIGKWKHYIQLKKTRRNTPDDNYYVQSELKHIVNGYLSNVDYAASFHSFTAPSETKQNAIEAKPIIAATGYQKRINDLSKFKETLDIFIDENHINHMSYLELKEKTNKDLSQEIEKSLESFLEKIKHDKKYCERCQKVELSFLKIVGISAGGFGLQLIAYNYFLYLTPVTFSISLLLSVALGLGVYMYNNIFVKKMAEGFAGVCDMIKETGYYAINNPAVGVVVVGVGVGLAYTGFAYRGYLKILLTWVKQNSGKILSYIINNNIDIQSADGEKKLFDCLYQVAEKIKQNLLGKLKPLPESARQYIDQKLDEAALKIIVDFLIATFLLSNADYFNKKTPSSSDKVIAQGPVLGEGEVDPHIYIYKETFHELDRLDEEAAQGFLLTQEKPDKYLPLFDWKKSLQDLCLSISLPALINPFVPGNPTLWGASLKPNSTSAVGTSSEVSIRARL